LNQICRLSWGGQNNMANMKQKMIQARSNLVLDEYFFGTLSLRLELIEDRSRKTMATNGKWIRFNPEYVEGLTMAQTQAVICHEVLHVSNGHPWRRDGRNQPEWNEACDYAINPIIAEVGMKLPGGILLDPQYKGLAAEQIFAKRKQAKAAQPPPQNQPQPPQDQGEGDPQPSPQDQPQKPQNDPQTPQTPPSDRPDQPQEGVSPQDDQEGSQGEKPQESAPQQSGDPDQGEGEISDQEIEPSCGEVEDCEDEDSEASEAEWQVATIQAAQVAMSRGSLPATLKQQIEKMKEATIDWKAILRRFMQNNAMADYSWRRPNPRYLSMGIYLPRLQSENMPAIVIGWDTSGSTARQQTEFATEVTDVIREVKPESTHVVYCDAEVSKVETFDRDELIEFKPEGGGGTDFRPVFDWVEKEGIEPACLIYFTDLDGTFPDKEPEYPVLWVSVGRAEAPFGETLQLSGKGGITD